jgi:hypothetical protein
MSTSTHRYDESQVVDHEPLPHQPEKERMAWSHEDIAPALRTMLLSRVTASDKDQRINQGERDGLVTSFEGKGALRLQASV